MATQLRPKEAKVADTLREAIISGRIPRGARLKQQEIADRLQTSITPVREALKLLEAEGYVAADNYRGATVAPFDLEASREVIDLRILLETKLIQAAVERVAGDDIAELKVMAREFAEAFDAGDNEGARAANYRFHHRLFEIAALPQTLHFVQILWARYPFDLINKLQGRVSRAAEEHDEMLGAIIAGDAADAMLATRQHIEAGWLELRDAYRAEIPIPDRIKIRESSSQ
jgi:DNA-binding GntR family transcriptional regulator